MAYINSKVYVTNFLGGSVSIIDTLNPTGPVTTVGVGSHPTAIAITPDGLSAYVANTLSGTVSIINTLDPTGSTITVTVGTTPRDIAMVSLSNTPPIPPSVGSLESYLKYSKVHTQK